ncbi:MAG: gamma-glutamyl-gamma-aminobutyrate hydrolase family protein [Woeseia sp.]|nr:gamma-glutamyl-gamma-aminobutyrate hydrolase family protein [Woeseia sp.]
MQVRPLIGIVADLKLLAPHNYHCVGDKYARAVVTAAGGVPFLIPAIADALTVDDILEPLNGLLLTGSYSNVHPRHYRGGEPYAGSPLDTDRDEQSLRLIPAAIERGLPLFSICRGFQELNVALGGTLHQKVHEVTGFDKHLEDKTKTLDEQYGLAHPVRLTSGGFLSSLVGDLTQQVNSLHGQGVDKLATGVTVEALADDGLVEAFTVDAARTFALAVQWHPEWKPANHPFYSAIWSAFGDACRDHQAARQAVGTAALANG